MNQKPSIIIIGGGLAGLSAAIHLRQLEFPVTLVEKQAYPKHKVCGEYVSNEVLPYLQWLGIDPFAAGAVHIDTLRFSTQSGKTITGKLPCGGFGLSRYTLDQLLYDRALESGTKIQHATVTDVRFQNNRFQTLQSDGSTLEADFVLGAYGKRAQLDQKLQRTFFLKKSPWLAVKMHYRANWPQDTVGLHHFAGGYCGVSQVEQGRINVCYLATFDSFKQHKDVAAYQAVLRRNPELDAVFASADPLFDKPLTISQVSFSAKTCVENHILMVGDTAGLIHPLCGNGMAMAVHSAKIASELLAEFATGNISSRNRLEQAYRSAWKKAFGKRLAWGRVLGRLFLYPKLSNALLGALHLAPGVLSFIVRQTHGEPLKQPAYAY